VLEGPVKVEFADTDGNSVAGMSLYPEGNPGGSVPLIIEENQEAAMEFGEARVQLLEMAAYEYVLDKPEFRILPIPGVVRPSHTTEEHDFDRGRITPGPNVGRLRFTLLDAKRKIEQGTAEVEVRSAKVDYRDDYRRMLRFITDRCTDLLLELRSPAEQTVLPDETHDPETLCQRFAFVRSLLASREFRDAVHRITALPHRLWEQEARFVPINRGIKPTAAVARQIASAFRRMPLPTGHPLLFYLPSVPERVTVMRNVETIDTPENRFVKHVLRTFQSFVAGIHERLEYANREGDERFIQEASALEEELAEVLSRDFFREISEPQLLPLGSSVLQRKGGYREILAAWLQFDMAARISWSGGVDVYGAGKRDVAALYEYWLFFRLLEIIAEVFHLDEPPAKSLIVPTADGFGLCLKAGRYFPLSGEFSSGGRCLKIKFAYNRLFTRANGGDFEKNFPAPGSWTERMKPDYTITLWPAGFNEEEAERQEVIVHIHFDAKYRVQNIAEIFGQPDAEIADNDRMNDDLAREKEAQKEGKYKRADLLKMHAYKDAIRRTAGAYVLYPGERNRQWRGFHEIVPGLGAFGIRPADEGEDGTADLKDFILQVVQHVCDRATRREQETYHRYLIQDPDGPPSLAVHDAPNAEYDINGRRALPPRETPVLVAWYQNETQLLWTDKKNLLILRIIADGKRGAVRLTPENVGAYYVLLHKYGQEAANGLYAVISTSDGRPTPPEVLSAATLKSKYHFPLKTGSDYYLVYRVEAAPEFAHYRWNLRQLLKRRGIANIASPLPFTATLDEVLNAAY
jgi:predicted component of viral defense system (DUF524 family)